MKKIALGEGRGFEELRRLFASYTVILGNQAAPSFETGMVQLVLKSTLEHLDMLNFSRDVMWGECNGHTLGVIYFSL